MPLIAVPANDIDVSGIALDVTLPADWLTTELAAPDVSAAAPGRLTARLSRSGGGGIVVRGRVQATLTTPCARCLAPAQVPTDVELALLLQPAPKAAHASQPAKPAKPAKPAAQAARKVKSKNKEPEYEFTAEEADVDTYDGETVVLDEFIREAILLELPNFPLCSEACPGIQLAARPSGETSGPAASGDAEVKPAPPIDPRLAPLGNLRDRLTQKKTKKE